MTYVSQIGELTKELVKLVEASEGVRRQGFWNQLWLKLRES